MIPFDNQYFIGYVSQVYPQYISIHFPSSTLLKSFVFSGEEFNGGLVGNYIVIEGENYGFFGQLQEILIPEKERLSLSDSAFQTQHFHPTAKAEILLAFDLFNPQKMQRGASLFPTIGSKVFVCSQKFVQTCLANFGIKKPNELTMNIGELNTTCRTNIQISQQALFSRHCAVVGTTGGGKSWTLAKLFEEAADNGTKCILIDPTGEYGNFCCKEYFISFTLADDCYVEYKRLTINDLFFLLKPSERIQAPKLLEAVRSLKCITIAKKLCVNDLDEYIVSHQNEHFILSKENKHKKKFIEFYNRHFNEIDDGMLDFDILSLPRQIQCECVYDSASPSDIQNFGRLNENDYSFCISLITRANSFLRSKDYIKTLGLNGPSSAMCNLTTEIDNFISPNSPHKVLRIGFDKVGYDFDIREIVANSLAKFLLNKARSSTFKENPIILMVDEAHQFINKKTSDDDLHLYSLNSFDQIAKECRKYGLFLCIATQMPRDIPVGTLSQMGTFIVHRLINYNDKEAIKQACGSANTNTLSYLPILGEGEALLIGVEFPMPLLLKIKPPNTQPNSGTPQFR